MTDKLDKLMDELEEAAAVIDMCQSERDYKMKYRSESRAAIAEKAAQRWIPVTERLPGDWVIVLVAWRMDDWTGDHLSYGLAQKFDDEIGLHTLDGDFDKTVTHWQPLLPLPVV